MKTATVHRLHANAAQPEAAPNVAGSQIAMSEGIAASIAGNRPEPKPASQIIETGAGSVGGLRQMTARLLAETSNMLSGNGEREKTQRDALIAFCVR